MKILDKYILFTFVKTFFSVFAILYFIFVLQALWMFIGELAGKDLDLLTIVKFLFYYSPRVISMILPLSVLVASIMTFGDFSENYEFAAMKSAGISLQRAMKYLIFFILGLGMVSFWFVNNVAPKAEYRFANLRHQIMQTKPAMAIAAGQFNDLGNINIKVDKKEGNQGQNLENVTMHMRSQSGSINKTVIKSDSGRIESSEGNNILKLHLLNGNYYEDISAKSYEQQRKLPFAKAHFEKYTISIDLNEFNTDPENQQDITNTATMMTVGQLGYTIDSLSTSLQREVVSHEENIAVRTESVFSTENIKATNDSIEKRLTTLSDLSKSDQLRILRSAYSNAESIKFNTQNNQSIMTERLKNINRHEHIFHEKFVLAFSCLLMFFIGAPLGAIIRKGGLGLPMIFAVIIFIVFHFINTFGKKLAQENAISGMGGAWMATLALLPLAITLTSRATKDRGINSIDNMLHPVIQYFKKLFPKKTKTEKNV